MAIDLYCEQATEFCAITAADLPPANRASNGTAYVVGPIVASKFLRFWAKVSVGVLTGSANVAAYLQACNTSNGSFVNIASNNAQAFTNTANTKLTVECRGDQLPSNGTSYVQLAVLVSANAAFTQAELEAFTAHYKPASQYNYTTNTSLLNQVVY